MQYEGRKKENLIVVVGAGASIKAGLPSTSDLLGTTEGAIPTIVDSETTYLIENQPFSLERRTNLADVLATGLTGAYKTARWNPSPVHHYLWTMPVGRS